MKLGSLFDGSGGFPLAGSLCGIEPTWASEVEPYPIAVTRSRFPKMKHLGDISKIDGSKVEPVDIITFGSPCQDLSVAGKRAGLKREANGDEETTRSGLFMEAVRIIREMKEATHGRYPSYALWENVPGAFSSNGGEDFRIVLEELIKIVEPTAVMPAVPKNGWPYADSYCGDGWSLAYRVFDAQYWGVPQRRRRIHLVLDLRGERAREVLFEREGVRGYFAEGRTPWQAAAAHAEDCAGADDREGAVPYTLKIRSGCEGGGKGALIQTDKSATLATNNDQYLYLFQPVCYGISSYQSNAMLSDNPHSGIYEASTSRTLDLNGGNPACNQGGIVIVEQRLMDAYQHHGWRENAVCGTLTAGQNDTVRGDTPLVLGVAKTYDARDNAVAYGINGDVAGTLDASYYKGCGMRQGVERDVVMQLASGKETVGTLMANAGTKLWLGNQEAFSGDYHIIEEREQPAVRYIVRRLTPTECARLQGFADRWGDIDHKEDFTDEEFRFWLEVRNTHAAINGKAVKEYTKEQMLKWYNGLHTDSAEYKMWGNGIALPPALYVLQGITDALNAYMDEPFADLEDVEAIRRELEAPVEEAVAEEPVQCEKKPQKVIVRRANRG